MTQAWSIARAMKRAVLIADDHPLFRDALKLAVAQAVPGAQIVEADSVHTLFAALDAHPDPELLLLDLNMPGAHGFNALVQARANFPTVPIVVISAREDRRIMQRALGHGAAAFVPKSASIDLIVTALRAVLGGDTWSGIGDGRQRVCSPGSTGSRRNDALGNFDAATVSRAVDVVHGIVEQADRRRAGCIRGDRQSARERGDAETRRQ